MNERGKVEHGSDVCFCGDYRSQHDRANRSDSEHRQLWCFCGCTGFKFGHRANADEQAHWEQYHGKKSGKRAEQ